MSPTRKLLARSVLFVLGLLPAVAGAQDVKVLLCFPGGPGTTADAQPVVDAFLKALSAQAGWSSASGSYTNDMAECRKGMAQNPSVVVLPLDLYLKEHTAWRLEPVAALANKETASRYHLVAKKGTTLAQVKGQKVATGIAADDAFISRIGFDGQLDVGKDVALTRTRTGLKAIKDLDKGAVTAAILDDVQQKAVADLPMAATLDTVLSGPTLPGAIVSAVGAPVKGLGDALQALCQKSAKTCTDMRVTGFSPVDKAQLDALGKKLAP